MKTLSGITLGLAALVLAGCGDTKQAQDQSAGPTEEGRKYLLTTEPEAPATVIQARQSAKDEEEITLLGRIGGSKNPWVDGRAAFSIVDPSLFACSDIPGDNCPHPWDYCCQTDKLPTSKALVKIVDENGELLDSDARELLGLKELDTVVIRGKAQRDDAGNLTVLASKLYVKPESEVQRAKPPADFEPHHHDHEHGEHEHGEHEHGDEEDGKRHVESESKSRG